MTRRRKKPRRNKRYLLTAVALSTGTLLSGCGSAQDEGPGGDESTDGVEGEVLPMPANPKGAVYDDGTAADPEPEPPPEVEPEPEEQTPDETFDEPDEETDDDAPEEGDGPPTPRPEPVRPLPRPRPLPLPANPKGAHYDDGPFAPPGRTPSEQT